MNCIRCHHTDEAHETTSNDSLLQRGRCMIPSCDCTKFSDAIKSAADKKNDLVSRKKKKKVKRLERKVAKISSTAKMAEEKKKPKKKSK